MASFSAMQMFGATIMCVIVWLFSLAYIGTTLEQEYPKWEAAGVVTYIFLTGLGFFVFGGGN